MDRNEKSSQYAFEFLEKSEELKPLTKDEIGYSSIISLEDVRYEKSRKALVESFRKSEFFRVMSNN